MVSSSSNTIFIGSVHSLYGIAFVVGRSNFNNCFNAIMRLCNGCTDIDSFRVNCFHLHSNCRADFQSGNPSTCAALIHVSPFATFNPVAKAPPLISLLCCRSLLFTSTVAPT